MDGTIIPWTIVTAIISSASALLAVFISNRAQERRLDLHFKKDSELRLQELKRQKLEEAFVLFQKWEMDITNLCIAFSFVYQGKSNVSQVREVSAKNSMQEQGDFQRFQAIINLYFPKLVTEFSGVMRKRGDLIRYCSDEASESGTLLDEFVKKQEEFELEAAKFRQAFVQASKNL